MQNLLPFYPTAQKGFEDKVMGKLDQLAVLALKENVQKKDEELLKKQSPYNIFEEEKREQDKDYQPEVERQRLVDALVPKLCSLEKQSQQMLIDLHAVKVMVLQIFWVNFLS